MKLRQILVACCSFILLGISASTVYAQQLDVGSTSIDYYVDDEGLYTVARSACTNRASVAEHVSFVS